jgi:hypothetical protein
MVALGSVDPNEGGEQLNGEEGQEGGEEDGEEALSVPSPPW